MTEGRYPTAPTETVASFVVVTGVSGAGKSEAIHALEDVGYLCVDNLPTALLPSFADRVVTESTDREKKHRSAVVVDVRDGDFIHQFPKILRNLRRRKRLGVVVVFLEASDDALVRRFSETRRPHPLAADRSVLEGIVEERKRLAEIKKSCDRVINTTDLTVHELRREFMELSQGRPTAGLVVTFVSFGYKYGIPLEVDLLLDVRFLPNPYFVAKLRTQTGRSKEVQSYVEKAEASKEFMKKTTDLLRFLIPHYSSEGKSYLTIGIGCTGGRHRSVVVAERLRRRLIGSAGIRFRVRHRDIKNQ